MSDLTDVERWRWHMVLERNPEAKAQAERNRRRRRVLRTPRYLLALGVKPVWVWEEVP